jgi:hypothetical protein
MGKLITMPEKPDYAGRMLALNPEKARTFQCGGFWLASTCPMGLVPPNAQMEPIRQALLDGRLLDVTDGNHEIKTSQARLNPVRDLGVREDRVAYLVKRTSPAGDPEIVVVMSKDANQAEDFRKQIEANGKIDLSVIPESELQVGYLTPIKVTDKVPVEESNKA